MTLYKQLQNVSAQIEVTTRCLKDENVSLEGPLSARVLFADVVRQTARLVCAIKDYAAMDGWEEELNLDGLKDAIAGQLYYQQEGTH